MADETLIPVVRLWIADVGTGEDQLLTDQQIKQLLDQNGDSARRAAADALLAIAASEVLVSKKIRTQDLATDGPSVSKELREQAAVHRQLADDQDSDGLFDVVPTLPATEYPERTDRFEPFGWY